MLGDLAMNHIVPIASKYEAQLLDKVYKMSQIGGLDASSDILLIKKIQDHTASIQKLTGEMIDARKVANRIEDPRAKRPLPTTTPWRSASTRSAAISTSWRRSSTTRSGRCRSTANCSSCGSFPFVSGDSRTSLTRGERDVRRYYPFVFREVKNGVNIEFSII